MNELQDGLDKFSSGESDVNLSSETVTFLHKKLSFLAMMMVQLAIPNSSPLHG